MYVCTCTCVYVRYKHYWCLYYIVHICTYTNTESQNLPNIHTHVHVHTYGITKLQSLSSVNSYIHYTVLRTYTYMYTIYLSTYMYI